MLPRKIVASGALRKVLNEKLKASQRKESPTQESDSRSKSEAFISASEGEEHGSSDTTKIQENPSEIWVVTEKGKAKAVESSEVAEEEEEEEMELVHQERGTTVEVPTPKPKRAKASSKKTSSEPVSDEPSLAKRTRSAVKGKQVKITEEEEEEEESEKEQDRFAIFGRRIFLKRRLLRDLDEQGMRRLVDALAA
ncbi:uncharacterized protein [Nicotiana sylvestris]|uniref:uncharacterized protein n=1 Tax=Nicotiana sylvestris TaxID=4096 RepID=UPI00388CCD56